MPVLAFKKDAPIKSFAGGNPETAKRWFSGEEREVSEATASYLLETFSDVFESVDVVAEAVGDPAVDKAIKSPAKKSAPKKRAPRKPKSKKADS